ncbi:MAG: ABC transporter permease [Gemmatimonadota bacterium]
MSKALVVVKREFTEFVGKRTFLVATVLGPLLMIGFFAVQFFFMSQGGGGHHTLVVLDATGRGIGAQVVAAVSAEQAGAGPRRAAEYEASVQDVEEVRAGAARADLRARVAADSLDGYLYLPAGLIDGGAAIYEGKNATNSSVTSQLRAATQQAVQGSRLADAGIDPARLGAALAPVRLSTSRIDERGEQGSAEGALIMGMLMGFAIYLMVLLYGAAIMNGVVEEKRDRIVELVMSSVRAKDLMLGKVVGIGGAGLLQMTIWVTVAALVVINGPTLAGLFGASDEMVQELAANPILPTLPFSAVLVFLTFFAGGFFLYATVYSILGAIATTAQEAQQLVFPAVVPLILGFFMMFTALENPDSTIAVVGGLIPFTSPLVMPVRVAMTGVPPLELALAIGLLFGTAYAMIWVGGKIYRIGMFATGKRASFRDVVRWIRTA